MGSGVDAVYVWRHAGHVDQRRLLGTRPRPSAHYGFALLPVFFYAVLWVFQPHAMWEAPVTLLSVAIAGYSIALLLFGLLIIHLTRGAAGLVIGTAVCWLAMFTLAIGPAIVLIALNILR